MHKLIIAFVFGTSLFFFTNQSQANHCGGGHKEIKETSETTSEDTKEDKSN